MSTYYLVNPAVENIIRKHLNKAASKSNYYSNTPFGVFHPFGLNIITDPSIPDRKISGYKRVKNILPDNKYFTMVTNEELKNPPSWAIFFGLVEPIYQYVVYKIDEVEFPKITYMDIDNKVRSEYVNKTSILTDSSKRRVEFFI